MPRPKVDRVARSVRLPVETDEALVAYANRDCLSINEAIERAVQVMTRLEQAVQEVSDAWTRFTDDEIGEIGMGAVIGRARGLIQ